MRRRVDGEKKKKDDESPKKDTVVERKIKDQLKDEKIKDQLKDEKIKDQLRSSLFSSWEVIIILLSSIVLRFVLYHSCGRWLGGRPELATPLVAIDRVREGRMLMEEMDGDAYAGDRVHVTPIMLHLLPYTCTDLSLLLILITVDTLSGIFLSLAASRLAAERGEEEERQRTIGTSVLKWFLLNPISMASCAALSISVLLIHLLAILIAAFVFRKAVVSATLLALSTQFSLYPVILLAPLLNRMKGERIATLCTFFLSLAALSFLNFHLGGGSWKFVEHTYLFNIRMDDLTPNVGIFWYFFTEIFTHFYDFFLVLFQLNIFVYVVPLALTLRNASFLNLLVSLALIAVFSPYPSLADASLFFALLPAIEEKHWKGMRHVLMESCTMLACIILMPVMWHLWIVSGSGNANFYFGVTLFYNVALIRMAIDIVYSYVRTELKETCPEGKEEDTLIYFD